MRRRDFGLITTGALGLALFGAPRDAHAGETLGKGSGFKVKAKTKEGKSYLLPAAKVALKTGQEVSWVYVAEFGDKKAPAFKLVEVKAGTGAAAFDVSLEGAPSPAFAKAPKDILIVHLGKPNGEPIVVEQPGN